MTHLFRAEWQKMTQSGPLVVYLIWIYPFAAFFGILMSGIAAGLFSETIKAQIVANPPQWTEMVRVVGLLSRFPENVFVRLPFLAFTAVVFAGEYQWGTWKNIVPHSQRVPLILTKFFTLGILIILVLIITGLVWGIGRGFIAWIVGVNYGPDLTQEVVWKFLRDYTLTAFAAFMTTIIAAAIAALIAMRSRSILASLLVSLGISLVEPVSGLFLWLIGRMLDKPEIQDWFRFAPTYNLDNFTSLIAGEKSIFLALPGFAVSLTANESLLMLILWVVVLVGITAVIFQRQDITS